MIKFSKLYKKASTGKLLEWEVWALGDTVFERHGQVGGTLQETPGTKCVGKQGRSNEEQASNEAKSKWDKKCKSHGYVTSPEAAMAGEKSELVLGGADPMLAHKFRDRGDKLKYPCYTQSKLDGARCVAVVDDAGQCTLWSRTRKPILSMPHIIAAIETLGLHDIVLDGELFSQAYMRDFEQLMSLIRPAYAKPEAKRVQYWIYDVMTDQPFSERTKVLSGILANCPKELVLVETRLVQNEDELLEYFQECIALGFEGSMARAAAGGYEHKRSNNLLKIKEMMDSEFEIVGIEEGRGKMAGLGIMRCKTDKGLEFTVKMKGALTGLVDYLKNPDKYIGKKLTVQYQNLHVTGVPRFPVGMRFKDPIYM